MRSDISSLLQPRPRIPPPRDVKGKGKGKGHFKGKDSYKGGGKGKTKGSAFDKKQIGVHGVSTTINELLYA